MRPADQMLDIPPPIVGVAIGWRTWLVMIASTLLGLFAIGWPLLIPAVGVAPEHADDAPFIFAALLPVILLLVIAQTQVFFLHAEIEQPFAAVIFPVLEPFQIGARFAEELEFHLLKFAGTENKVTRGDLVSEALTDLADTERHLFTSGSLNILKVYENTLSGFGTKVNGRG